MRLNTLVLATIAVAAVGGGYLAWTQTQGDGLPPDIVFGNGRVEAVQVDITSMVAGRVETVTVREGDLVDAEQVVATIDDATIRAQLAQAQAEVAAAEAQVAAAKAAITQAEALLKKYRDDAERMRELNERGTSSEVELETAETSVATGEADVAAAEAALVAYERSVDAARAVVAQIETNLDYTELTVPTRGRILYRLVEPGEVVASGTQVLTMVDLSEVYLEFYLPATQAHRVAVGSDARIKLDVIDGTIPATVTYVSTVSQFTPREVETADERQNLVFRVRVRIPQELVENYIEYVRTGIRGVAYVRLAPEGGAEPSPWPDELDLVDQADLPVPVQ